MTGSHIDGTQIVLLRETAARNTNNQPLIELIEQSVKVLGITWNPNEDCFQFKVIRSVWVYFTSNRIGKNHSAQMLWLTGIST